MSSEQERSNHLAQELLSCIPSKHHKQARSLLNKLIDLTQEHEEPEPASPSTERQPKRSAVEHGGVKSPHFQVGHVYPPSSLEEVSHKSEDSVSKQLELEYVYGWSKKGCRGSILVETLDGNLAYPSAACGVVLDPSSNHQKAHLGHTDDCVCIDVHPSEPIVATGQIGPNGDARVLIWRSDTLETLCEWIPTDDDLPSGGIIDLSFSPDGHNLAVMAGSLTKSLLYIYDWKKQKKLHKVSSIRGKVFMIQFYGQDTVVIASAQGIKVVKLNCTRGVLRFRNAVLSHKGTHQTSYSIASKGDYYVCGMKDGSLYFFKSNRLVSMKENAHKGSVWTVHVDDSKLVSGGKDGKLNVWRFKKDSSVLPAIELEKTIDFDGSIRTVTSCKQNDNIIYVGLMEGDIIRCNIESEEKDILMSSHFGDGELWGLATKDSFIFSASDDGFIRVWDKAEHKCIKHRHLEELSLRSIGINHDTGEIVTGSLEGDVIVLSEDLETKHELQDGDQEISVVTFSPCGRYLAVGSHDCKIYLHSVEQNYKQIARLDGHTSYITHVDWSSDSQYLQSTCGAYELLYWDFEHGDQITASQSMKDAEWHTQTCTLGWGVRGMWEPGMDGTDINACWVNFDLNLLAASDDFGLVQLLNYPTLTDQAPRRKYEGHCSHVTNVTFTTDSKHVVSAGGGDLTLFQWRIVE